MDGCCVVRNKVNWIELNEDLCIVYLFDESCAMEMMRNNLFIYHVKKVEGDG